MITDSSCEFNDSLQHGEKLVVLTVLMDLFSLMPFSLQVGVLLMLATITLSVV